jgi:hypothetical protein
VLKGGKVKWEKAADAIITIQMKIAAAIANSYFLF